MEKIKRRRKGEVDHTGKIISIIRTCFPKQKVIMWKEKLNIIIFCIRETKPVLIQFVQE